MPERQLQIVPRGDFSGGINTIQFPTLIGQNQAVMLQNMTTEIGGQLSTISGLTQIGNTAVSGATGRIRGMGRYVLAGVEYLCAVDSQNPQHLWTIAAGDSTWTDRGALTDFTSANEVYMEQVNDFLYLVDGEHLMLSWDGTVIRQSTDTNSDAPEGLSQIVWSFGRMWGILNGQLYFSRPLFVQTSQTGSDFSGGWDRTIQYINIEPNTGNTLTAIEPIRNEELIVFSTNTIWRVIVPQQSVFGVTTFGIPINPNPIPFQVSRKIGSRSRDTIQLIGSDLLFMDQFGQIRSLRRTEEDESKGIETKPISYVIRPTLNSANKSVKEAFSSFYDGESYYLSYAEQADTENTVSVSFDVEQGSWAGPHTLAFSKTTQSSFSVGDLAKIYVARPEDNFKIYEVLSGTSFDGSAIEFRFRSRREDFGSPFQQKIGRWVEFYFLNGAQSIVTINYSVDGGGLNLLGSLDLSGDAGTLPTDLPFVLGSEGLLRKQFRLTDAGPFFDLQFEVVHSDLDESVTFLGYNAFAELREPRRSTETWSSS